MLFPHFLPLPWVAAGRSHRIIFSGCIVSPATRRTSAASSSQAPVENRCDPLFTCSLTFNYLQGSAEELLPARLGSSGTLRSIPLRQ